MSPNSEQISINCSFLQLTNSTSLCKYFFLPIEINKWFNSLFRCICFHSACKSNFRAPVKTTNCVLQLRWKIENKYYSCMILQNMRGLSGGYARRCSCAVFLVIARTRLSITTRVLPSFVCTAYEQAGTNTFNTVSWFFYHDIWIRVIPTEKWITVLVKTV